MKQSCYHCDETSGPKVTRGGKGLFHSHFHVKVHYYLGQKLQRGIWVVPSCFLAGFFSEQQQGWVMTWHFCDDWLKDIILLFFLIWIMYKTQKRCHVKIHGQESRSLAIKPVISRFRRGFSSYFHVALALFFFWLNLKRNQVLARFCQHDSN